MKVNMKKRMAIFLSIMLVLPTIIMALPMASTEVSAASSYVLVENTLASNPYTGVKGVDEVKIEVGTKLNFGDYVNVTIVKSRIETRKLATDVKAKYKSSKKSVASVSSKGVVTAKKTGTAKITVSYQGKKVEQKFKVVKKGTLKSTPKLDGLKKKALAIKNNMPSKVTAKNAIKVYKLVKDYENYVSENEANVSKYGFATKTNKHTYGNMTYITYEPTEGLIVPEATYYCKMARKLSEFLNANRPTGSSPSAKMLVIKSASKKKDGIAVKFTKKVSQEQVLSAKLSDSSFGSRETSSTTKAYASVEVFDTKDKKYYSGRMEIKKGSNKGTITLYKYDFEKRKYVKQKINSGRMYRIFSVKNTIEVKIK